MASGILALLVLLGATAAEPPPSSASADDITRYATDAPDVFLYFNADATIQPALTWIANLENEAFVKASPDLSQGLAMGIAEMDKGLQQIQTETGIDITRDVHYAAAWITIQGKDDVDFIVAINGNFPSDFMAKAATQLDLTSQKSMGGKDVHYNTTAMPGGVAAFQTSDGFLLLGSQDLVEARAAKDFKAPKSASAKRVKKLLDAAPFAILSLTPGKTLRTEFSKELDNKSARDLFDGMVSLDLALRHNGIDIMVETSSPEIYKRFHMILDGFVDFARATSPATRGMAKAVLGILSPDDPTLDAELQPILQESDAILDFILRHTGDGNFKVKDTSKVKEQRLEMHLDAGHLREILSPAIVAGFFMFLA